MTVACIGGGPAGLFLSILLKTRRPGWDVAVYEQNPRGNTFGWGIVFSDGTMENLRAADAAVARETEASLAHWDDIEVRFRGEVLRSSGHGFIGVGRHRFLEILEERAEAVGVRLHFGCRVEEPETLGADLVVACDGVNSAVRARYARHFRPTVEPTRNRYTWLGTHRPFEAFTFDFQETEWGWFQAHCYQFSEDTSTFIVECTEEAWRAAGLDRRTKAQGLAFCEDLFRDLLDGHRLLDNAPHLEGPAMWIRFPKVTNETWHHSLPRTGSGVVLLGDAAATAHFSIGSGTKLALESAIALADKLTAREEEPLCEVLDAYEEERRVEVLRLQNAARNSTEWFESVSLRAPFEPEQFAYSLLTRSQRVSHENLRLRDQAWLEGYERWWAAREEGGEGERERGRGWAEEAPSLGGGARSEAEGGGGKVASAADPPSPLARTAPPRGQEEAEASAVPPMFVPFTVRGVTLPNRVVVSPMAMYSAEDGLVNDFHLVHLGQRALGGAGMVFTEMTCVAPDARITPGCAGLWTDEQAGAYARIVRFIHQNSPAKAALQLGHAGPKGSVKKPWEAPDDITPLDDGNWPLLSPSPVPYTPKNQTPKAMGRADMDRVRDQFAGAARRGAEAGFDWLELHCAHGYLLSAFLSPLTNHRTDEYGGPVENRVRYPLEVFDALRAAWPEDRPLSVRISAVDWVDGGNTVEDAVAIARAFAERGAELIDVSTGQVSKQQKPVYGRMYQTPFAERIRLETGLATMAVGNIYEPDHVNSILAAGRADLCLLARPHLWNPHWTLFAAADLAYGGQWWPNQYLTGRRQIERIFERQKEMAG